MRKQDYIVTAMIKVLKGKKWTVRTSNKCRFGSIRLLKNWFEIQLVILLSVAITFCRFPVYIATVGHSMVSIRYVIRFFIHSFYTVHSPIEMFVVIVCPNIWLKSFYQNEEVAVQIAYIQLVYWLVNERA